MDNQHPSLEQRKDQRLERKLVHCKRLAVEVASVQKDEDIVYTLMKVRGVFNTLDNEVAFIIKYNIV